jgi:hypothetical protein
MFIRWKRRRLRRHNDVALVAVLVQSRRIQGVPRQRLVRYLGSIPFQKRMTTAARQVFWQRVAARLTALALAPATRTALEDKLARVVPVPASMPSSSDATTPGAICYATGISATAGSPPRASAPLPSGLSVRWRRRRLRRIPEEAWDAILVQRARHQGAPRSQVVRYLASIRARYHTAPAHRAWFWTRVESRLSVLALDPATQQAVAVHLAQMIPRPTPGELADVAAQRAALAHWVHETGV